MNKRTVVTLDFRPCRYISQIYQEMRLKMKWDEDYGENLSALWDILWGMPYYGDDFLILRPLQYNGIPHGQNQEFTRYVDKICGIFQRAQGEGILNVEIQYQENMER